MSDYDYDVLMGIIDQKKWEIKRLEKDSMFVGFMKTEYQPALTNSRLEKIQNSLSVREYNLLRNTCYMSSKEEVSQYIEVLKKMLDAGIFDSSPESMYRVPCWSPSNEPHDGIKDYVDSNT